MYIHATNIMIIDMNFFSQMKKGEEAVLFIGMNMIMRMKHMMNYIKD